MLSPKPSNLTAREADNTRRQHSPPAARQVAAALPFAVASPPAVGMPRADVLAGVQPLPGDAAVAAAAVAVAEHKRSCMAGSRRQVPRTRVPGRAEDW